MTELRPGSVAGTTAPPAPGRLGVPVEPAAAMSYLDALVRWRDDRRRELDQLDAAALQSPKKDELTHDITLSFALWKAASDRSELLVATWDSGRVGQVERERMSALIWGRLDATLDPSLNTAPRLNKGAGQNSLPAGMAISLPEACRLSDALAAQLRVRLELDPSGLQVAEHVRQLRAQLERIRDQVSLEPVGPLQDAGRRDLDRLAGRLDEIAEKASRGGDVGGLLGPLEIDAAKSERDLIVNAATRRDSSAKVDQARTLRADLQAREAALHSLVAQCLQTVEPAPHYAVPDVEAIGPVPNTLAALDAYLSRLGQVSRALMMAQDAYSQAMHEHGELRSRLDAYHAKAVALRIAEDADVAQAYTMAVQALDRKPSRMIIASQLVSLYQSYLTITQPNSTDTFGSNR